MKQESCYIMSVHKVFDEEARDNLTELSRIFEQNLIAQSELHIDLSIK